MDAVAQLKGTAIPVINVPSAYISDLERIQITRRTTDLAVHAAMNAFVPLLEKYRAEIESIQRKTFQYGTTERHKASIRWSSFVYASLVTVQTFT